MTNWTQEREAEIQARCDAVPKGPWETGSSIYETVDWEVSGPYARGADGRQTIALIVGGLEDEDAKKIRDRDLAEFIAHARTDLPDALDEIKRLREELISAWPHTAFTCPCSDRLAESAPLDKCDCGLTKALYAPEGGGA